MMSAVELEESLRGQRIALEEIPLIDFGPFLTGDLAQRKAVAEKIGHAAGAPQRSPSTSAPFGGVN